MNNNSKYFDMFFYKNFKISPERPHAAHPMKGIKVKNCKHPGEYRHEIIVKL